MTVALPRKQDRNLDAKPNRKQIKYRESSSPAAGSPALSVIASAALMRGNQPLEKPRTPDPNYLAHDARNWLTVLQVYCDLLRTSGAVNSGYEPWIEELSSAVERGHTLVASLLDSVDRAASAALREFPSGKVPSLDIADAIARRQPMFEHLAGSRIHVEIDAPAGAGTIAMPESEFERILQNLVSNAIEAMPDGGCLRLAVLGSSRSQAEAQKHPAPKTLLLRVSDTGGGISPERLPAIFAPGVSSKGVSGKRERTGDSGQHGFGLAIVQELTERAGGWVRVQSQPGRGSCFELEFPQI